MQFTAKVFLICLSVLLGLCRVVVKIAEVEKPDKLKKKKTQRSIPLHGAFILE